LKRLAAVGDVVSATPFWATAEFDIPMGGVVGSLQGLDNGPPSYQPDRRIWTDP